MKLQTRRSFLATIGVGALGLAGINAVPASCSGAAPGTRKLKKVGLQLYTVRDLMKDDMPGTLAKVAAAGYQEVEFAGYYGRTPAQIRQLLQQNGLTSPSSHLPIDAFEKNAAATLADAKAIGNEWATLPWIPEERRKTADDWKHIATLLNGFGAQAKSQGLRFAYHNHDFELRPIGGTRPLDILLSETDPSLVDFEMDLYWVVFGGGDPLDFFNRYPGRFQMVHVKDSAGPPDNKMVDVGSGKIDFRTIFAQSDKAGIKHYFVEHDQPANPIATITNSANYLHALTF
ncbi:MAG: sugar phosphate isomerase/epimerase [Gemmatimonadetes bacterium]|nr:MAG: sugar phosphate isomerase/epimerase [Gemmatimonadota bacterium]PYO80530.1 MAG: sugar phosphate isomerase/epimerase [Gemmatimonadota bacterium]